jgi:uncharacterized protein YegL
MLKRIEQQTASDQIDSQTGDLSSESVIVEKSEVDDFFQRQRGFLEKYAGDSSIRVETAPPALGTFAINLEDGVMYAEPKFFTDRGYSLPKAMFATLHEFEHFREMKELLDEAGGDRIWERHRTRTKAKRRLGIFDNLIDDIKMNRQVIGRAPVLSETRSRLYQENLFSNPDLRDAPKHLQFGYALLRRAMLPEEEIIVDPQVQVEIDRLDGIESRGVKLLDFMTQPDTIMSLRLKLQERFLEPVMEKLFQEDVQNKKKENEAKKKGGKGSGGNGENDDMNGDTDDSNNEETDDTEENEQKGKKNKKSKPKKKSKSGKQESTEDNGAEAGSDSNGESTNPEDYFKNEYDEHEANNPEPIDYSDQAIAEKIEEYLETQKGKSAEQEALEAYARAEGVSLNEIKQYQRFFSQLEGMQNPETGEQVLEELRAIFKKIIAERKKSRYAPKHPMSEGEILIRPAEAVTAVMAGENEPEVWETLEKKDLPQELFGDFDVTLVCDRSGSMQGEKATQQRQAVVLILEALKEFCDELNEMRSELKHDLNVRSEVWGFGGKKEVKVLKPLSEQLTEKQRVSVYQSLAEVPGDSTMDFLALEKIKAEVTEEEWQKIKDRKLRKVIIVLTDGASDDSSRVQKSLKELETAGVAVIGIGITASGKSAEITYAPNGLVCVDVNQLSVVLAELLKNYLKDLLIKK